MSEKYASLYEVLSTWFGSGVATLIVALFGRLMWHGNEARKGRRKFFGVELIWELPMGIGMAFIGEGLASYLNIGQPASTGLIAVLAYLGPRGSEVLLQKWFNRRFIG